MSDVSVEFDRDDGKSDMACIQECWIVWHGLLKWICDLVQVTLHLLKSASFVAGEVLIPEIKFIVVAGEIQMDSHGVGWALKRGKEHSHLTKIFSTCSDVCFIETWLCFGWVWIGSMEFCWERTILCTIDVPCIRRGKKSLEMMGWAVAEYQARLLRDRKKCRYKVFVDCRNRNDGHRPWRLELLQADGCWVQVVLIIDIAEIVLHCESPKRMVEFEKIGISMVHIEVATMIAQRDGDRASVEIVHVGCTKWDSRESTGVGAFFAHSFVPLLLDDKRLCP